MKSLADFHDLPLLTYSVEKLSDNSSIVANYGLKQPTQDQALGVQLIEASSRYPRFGYRRIAVMTDTKVSRVWRLWSKLGLNLPKRRPRTRRCGSDIRIPGSTAPDGVWTYDFVHDQLANGGPLKMLCVLDGNTRECLAIEVGKSLRSQDVILTLSRLMRIDGKPVFIRSDNGAEFTATVVYRSGGSPLTFLHSLDPKPTFQSLPFAIRIKGYGPYALRIDKGPGTQGRYRSVSTSNANADVGCLRLG